MNSRLISLGTALSVMAGLGLVLAQTPAPTTVDNLVSTAKNAAGTDWAGTFLRLCIPPPGTGRGAAAATSAAPAANPGRAANAGRAGNAAAAGNAAPAGRAGLVAR